MPALPRKAWRATPRRAKRRAIRTDMPGLMLRHLMVLQRRWARPGVASGRFPAFAAVVNELDAGFDLEIDVLFELGLRSAGSRGG